VQSAVSAKSHGIGGLVVHLGGPIGQPVELHGLGGQHQEPREHGR
jgi:hypothetical protein